MRGKSSWYFRLLGKLRLGYIETPEAFESFAANENTWAAL
jgi:hypothetical protein